MKKPQIAPYGSWKSLVSAEKLAEQSVSYQSLIKTKNQVAWLAMATDVNATYGIYTEADKKNILPMGFSARSLVYDYGGGSVCASANDDFYFVNYNTIYSETLDQRVYRWEKGKQPQALTPLINARFGDLVFHEKSGRVIAVCETYTQTQEGDLMIVAIDGKGEREMLVLDQGHDYCSSPSISPNGEYLAWITWERPNMPWDFNQLWIAKLDDNGNMVKSSKKCVAEAKLGSNFQPIWTPDSKKLVFSSDRDEWWKPYIYDVKTGRTDLFCKKMPEKSEFGTAQWYLGMSLADFLDKNTLAAAYTSKGVWKLGIITSDSFQPHELSFEGNVISDIDYLKCFDGKIYFIGGGVLVPFGVYVVDAKTMKVSKIDSQKPVIDLKDYIATATPITVNKGKENEIYAFYYAPTNPDFQAPEGEKPPLLIKTHGGPTAMTTTTLNSEIQYFTSRGFAVVDVNYRGSTGYGRSYRRALYGEWGVFDLEDCVSTGLFLGKTDIDLSKIVARGVSAGGYLTVVQATYSSLLAAGCSISGITNINLLYEGTHKFEKYYIIELMGTSYSPTGFLGDRFTYLNTFKLRSPYYVAGISTTPMMFVQGKGDKVVPPDQTEVMVQKLEEQGVPVYELMFADEQHGIRKAANLITALNAEFYFYSQMLGFTPADNLPKIDIKNWKGN